MILRATVFGLGLVLVAAVDAGANQPADDPVLVTVGSEEIRESEVAFELQWRKVPESRRAGVHDQILEELVDRRLIQGFLKRRRVAAPPEAIDARIELVRRVIGASGEDVDSVLAKLGFTEERLRDHLTVPLAWDAFISQTVTDQQLRRYFDEHRPELDGTELRLSQIVLTVAADADEAAWAAAEKRMSELRRSIVDDEADFATLAREHSQSPSKADGGDLGFVRYEGRLPRVITRAAFPLAVGEVSDVIRSPFGVHLVKVTERRAGELSLEDVRDAVVDRVSAELWEHQAQTERERVRIRKAGP